MLTVFFGGNKAIVRQKPKFAMPWLIAALIVCLHLSGAHQSVALGIPNPFAEYQKDADLARLEHLLHWSGLVEEYHREVGHYPLQDQIGSDRIGFVRIVTRAQEDFFAPESDKYIPEIDNNANDFFQQFGMKEFVVALQAGLAREITEMYDIQNIPSKSTIGYNYFVTEDGYAIWVPCGTCGVTEISTLLMDGSVATVNIASEGMVEQVFKSLTRDDMISHPTFKGWMARGYIKEGYVRQVETINARDSKARP